MFFVDQKKDVTFIDIAGHSEYILGYTHRSGGVSTGSFAALNMGLHTGDDAEKVKENRTLFFRRYSIPGDAAVFARQTHGDGIFQVRSASADHGSLSLSTAIDNTDSLITALPNRPLCILTADCLPVIIVDPRTGVISAVHAGWRGTVLGILGKTVTAMARLFNCNPEDFFMIFGPAICGHCFEVRADFIRNIEKHRPDMLPFLTHRNGKHFFDLIAANRAQAGNAGIRHLYSDPPCTYEHSEQFFSYRRDRETGRFMSFILRRE